MDNSEYLDIYLEQADGYQQLVEREDYMGNILPALQAICDVNGRIVVEMGAGTARLTKMLAPAARAVYGFDNSTSMLQLGRREMAAVPCNKWVLAAAEHRALPLAANSCDLLLSGWSLCYLALDQGEGWEAELRQVFRRLRQLLRPGGTIIILETMGTGFSEPAPPPFLLDYFSFLTAIGLQHRWIRTDYRFASVEEAVRLTRFFFGEELSQQVEEKGSTLVPECTGIWWTNDAASLLLDE